MKLKVLTSAVFALVLSSQAAISQDIGLLADDDKFISLSLRQKSTARENAYSGHITTFDMQRGFLHAEIDGTIRDRKFLELNKRAQMQFQSLTSKYARTKSNSNTVWVRTEPCDGDCPTNLVGTTLRNDRAATQVLEFYESNTEKNSLAFQEYVGLVNAMRSSCSQGKAKYCTPIETLGIVLPRSQVGAAQLVANSFGERISVATFNAPRYDGAVVSASFNIVDAVVRSTGLNFNDRVLDFSRWQIVPASQLRALGLQLINLRIDGRPRFFERIVQMPSDISKINDEMEAFFFELSGPDGNCDYSLDNYNPYFRCLIHSDDLGSTGPGAWLSAWAFMTPRQAADETLVTVHVLVGRQYNRKGNTPDPLEFQDIDYSNADEAFLASLMAERVAKKFQTFFEPGILVSRN